MTERQVFEPEVLQSGFGVIFYFGLPNFRTIAGDFLSEVRWRTVSEYFSALFFEGFRRPKEIHALNSRPNLSAFLSIFTFSSPKCFTPIFCLRGRPNLK